WAGRRSPPLVVAGMSTKRPAMPDSLDSASKYQPRKRDPMIRRLELGSAPARLALLATMLLVLACAPKTRIANREPYAGEMLPRPDRILVYPFAARTEDLPPWSEAAKTHPEEAVASEEEVDVARNLGSQMAHELVERIEDMGLPAERTV